MLFVWIALWIVALILLLSDLKSSTNRRLSAVAFCGGAGALAVVLHLSFIPYIEGAYSNAVLEKLLFNIQAGSSLLCYYGLPYSFLLFSLAYRPIQLHNRTNRIVAFVLLLPIIGCLLFTPAYNNMYPITFTIVVWWAIPYFIAGTLLVLLKKSSHNSLSHTHWMICLTVLPPVLTVMIMSYLLPSFGMLLMWKYNPWVVGFGVVMFTIGLFTYGFLGIRVLIDRRRLDSTLRAVTSGTAILHHAIKNDVGKMRLFTEKMKAYAESTNQPELLEDIQVVQHASKHIQEMISRVHRRTEDLEIRPVEVELSELIEQVIKPYEPLLDGIQLHLNVTKGWHCRLDPAQVGEALNNIIANAIDAMGKSGRLFITLRESKRELTIEVRDTGSGMDKSHRARALEPFYTTKSNKDANFGLGLPYAYYVMRKHGGTLHIRSKPDIGTRIYFAFSKKNIKAQRIIPVTQRGGDTHG